MAGPRTLAAALALACLLSLGATSATAAVVDTHGREWRQLYETTGLTWNQIASVCPRDGVTPCSGTVGGKNLDRWVWATDAQVIELMSEYAPDLLTANPPSVSGPAYFGQAAMFLGAIRWTVTTSLTYSYSEWTGGWTASTDAAGAPVGAAAGFHHPIFNGHLGVGPAGGPDEVNPYRGAWLWRPAGLDYTPPAITPNLAGTLGNNGWYVSKVTVSWNVTDAESPIDSRTGCGTTSVSLDTKGATFTCQATSVGGTASRSVVVKRDTTAPVITCQSPGPVVTFGAVGARVSAAVTDATSGPVVPSVSALASTNVLGARTVALTAVDRAGRTATKQCGYTVALAPCRGLAPTLVGTPANDVIQGTLARDVIVGLGGADTINGVDGNDVICGGDGPDQINAGRGADLVDGGASNDSINGGDGNDDLDGGLHLDSIRGDGGTDTCTSGEERMSSCEILR